MDASASQELWRHTRSNIVIVNPDAPMASPSLNGADKPGAIQVAASPQRNAG
jgi:hypothetical protein